MNTIYLQGKIVDIEFSHESNDKQYDKALIEIDDNVHIPIKFREDMLEVHKISENDIIATQGTLRTYSKSIYVHTNLAPVEIGEGQNCLCTLQGKVVKCDNRYHSYIIQCYKDTYIPIKSDKEYEVDSIINVVGYLIERPYTKRGKSDKFITYEVVEL